MRRTEAARGTMPETGSGLNACMASDRSAWMKRHQPERLRAARRRLSLQGLALFQADRRAGDRPVGRRASPSAISARAPMTLDSRGDGHRRLRPAAAADRRGRRGTAHPLSGGGRHRDRLAAGLPVDARLSRRRLHGAWAAAFTTQQRRGRRFSIFGSTGMHMRYAANAGRGHAQRGALRLHDVLPDRRRLARRCSRTWRRRSISTGCSTSRARRRAWPARERRARHC